jgi:hypothetical protein
VVLSGVTVAVYSGVEEAAAVVVAAGSSGISIGTPAALHVDSTASMAFFWSASEHAFCVHGWTLPRSSVPLLQ